MGQFSYCTNKVYVVIDRTNSSNEIRFCKMIKETICNNYQTKVLTAKIADITDNSIIFSFVNYNNKRYSVYGFGKEVLCYGVLSEITKARTPEFLNEQNILEYTKKVILSMKQEVASSLYNYYNF